MTIHISSGIISRSTYGESYMQFVTTLFMLICFLSRKSVSFSLNLRKQIYPCVSLLSTLKTIQTTKMKRSNADADIVDSSKVSKKIKGAPDQVEENKLSFVPSGFQVSRARLLSQQNRQIPDGNCVILWMSRDQRVFDNHALHFAQSVAISRNIPLRVVFNMVPRFLDATLRQYAFMIEGLKEVETQLRELQIPFHLLFGNPLETLPQFVQEKNAALVVTDFSPLRVPLGWVTGVAQTLDTVSQVPVVQVDAHNIVPCWVASPKLEYSARTFRGKIVPKIPEYLREVPAPSPNPEGSLDIEPIDWSAALARLEINRDVREVSWIRPGYTAAQEVLKDFIDNKLKQYGELRNDPTKNFVSNLSPYFHFGQISAEKVVLTLRTMKKTGSSVDSFVEESVVRRELTDNFCFYNPKYDSLEGCYEWARETLQAHRNDPRPILYTRAQFEAAMTHDDLWNAAQLQMVQEGKMHGFLRMYWAKKILEWSASPDEALATALYLNDKYELDGRDPNGYVGCMWSIGGIHDQGWGERAIFGKIRYMNYQGCQRKFDVKKFVAKYPPAATNAARASGQSTLRL